MADSARIATDRGTQKPRTERASRVAIPRHSAAIPTPPEWRAVRDCAGVRPSSAYTPRAPAESVLYQIVRDYFETFRADAARAHDGDGLPRFIEEEFRGYLRCGFLAGGFARFHCGRCGLDRLVPFSCKGRAVCPSCGGRRMAERAAHLVDHVFPVVSVRQWVLSLPHRLRYVLAWDHALCRAVTGVVVPPRDRARLERLCRYALPPQRAGKRALGAPALRPPIAQERLHLTPEGQVIVDLRHRWADGTTYLVFEPQELLERLAAVTPRPRINLLLYYGVLGARSAWRSRIVATSTIGAVTTAFSGRSIQLRRR